MPNGPITEYDKLIAALRDLAEVNRKMAASIREVRLAAFPETADDDGCPYCAGNISHTAALCRRSGGEG